MKSRDLGGSGGASKGRPLRSAVPYEAMVGAGFTPEDSAGVFVGVRHFTVDRSFREVPYAVDDAVDMAYRLGLELGLIAGPSISLCISGMPQKEISRNRLEALRIAGARIGGAELNEVCREIAAAGRKAGPKGAFFCTFASHGFENPRSAEAPYLLVSNSFEERLEKSAITLAELKQDINKTRSQRRFLLVDACREHLHLDTGLSSRRVGKSSYEGIASALSQFEGTVVFSATDSGGFAYDDDEHKNGVYTRGILEGLAGAATPDSSGFIRAAELAEYARKHTVAWINGQELKRGISLGQIRPEVSYTGEGAKLPLAIRPEAYEAALRRNSRDAFEDQRGRCIKFIEEAGDMPGFTDDLIADVCMALRESSREEQELLLKRIERLYTEVDEAEDFVSWWARYRGETPSLPSGSGYSNQLPPLELTIDVDVDTIMVGGWSGVILQMPGIGPTRKQVRIPRWAVEGELIRLPREGPNRCDLHLKIRYIDGITYRLADGELMTDLSIPYVDAFKGTSKTIALPDGDLVVKIPAGSNKGGTVRVSGRGLRKLNAPIGDLIVRLIIETEQAKEEDSSSSSDNLTLEQLIKWRPVEGATVPDRKNWRIVSKLGQGGFGEAWLIEQPKSQHKRVLKFCFDIDKLAAMRREVALLQTLYRNPLAEGKIARAVDWRLESPPYFVEFEYYRTGSLDDIARRIGGMEKIPFNQRLRFMAQIAGALHFAHQQGVLHRDIKPSNILVEEVVGEGQRALLADFGIGTIQKEMIGSINGLTGGAITATGDSQIGVGSRLYLAPELLEGKPPTEASDIYAFGVTFYQVMVGDTSAAIGHGWERRIKIPEIQEIIGLCIELNTKERIANAGIVHTRLQDLIKQKGLEYRTSKSNVDLNRAAHKTLGQRLFFWNRGQKWVDSRPKPRSTISLNPLAWVAGGFRFATDSLAALGWIVPAAITLLVLAFAIKAGDLLFKRLLLEEIDRTSNSSASRSEQMSNFHRVYGTPSPDTAAEVITKLTADPKEDWMRQQAVAHFERFVAQTHQDLSRLYPGLQAPKVETRMDGFRKELDDYRRATITVSVPAWMPDQRPMGMVCVLYRAKRFDQAQLIMGLSGNRSTDFVFEATLAPSKADGSPQSPDYRFVSIEPEADWQAMQKLLSDLEKLPDQSFQKGMPLSLLMENPELIPDKAMSTYLIAAKEAKERAVGTRAALNGARDAIMNARNNIRNYRANIASLGNQVVAAEKREREKSKNNNQNEEDNQPGPEHYRAEIRRYESMIESTSKQIPILTREVTVNERRTEQDEMERDLQYLNMANYLTTRFPYQANEAARFILDQEGVNLTIRKEADQVLNYSRLLIGRDP